MTIKPDSSPGLHMMDGVVRVFLAESLFPLTGLLTAAFLSRRLGPGDYGLFSMAAVLIAWIEFTIVSFFSRATVKLVSEAEDYRPVGTRVVQLYLMVSVVATVGVWLFAGVLAGLLDAPKLAFYLRIFSLDIPVLTAAWAHRQILIGMGAFRQRAGVSAGRWIARLILIILLVELGFSVEGAILGSIGASFVELAIARYHVRPPILCRSTYSIRKLMAYATPLFLASLSLRFLESDLFFLKGLGGTPEDAGHYVAAQNLSMMPSLLGLSISGLLLSTLSRLVHENGMHTARTIGRNSLRLIVGIFPFAGMIAGANSEITTVIFGRDFIDAGPLLACLIFAAVAMVLISMTNSMLVAAGRPRLALILTAPLLLLAVCGHLLWIPRLGALGAAQVTLLVTGIGAMVGLVALHQVWSIRPRTTTCLRSALLCFGAYVCARIWPTTGVFVLPKLILISLAILIGYWGLREFDRSEIRFLRASFATQFRTAPGVEE